LKGKKFILLLIPVAILVALVYIIWGGQAEEVPITSQNLVLNPDFETLDSSDKPNFWKEDPKGGWSVDAEKLYRGKRSMRATVAWSWLSQEIPIRAKRYYTLKVYLRSDMAIPEKEDYYNTFLTLECLNWRKKVIKREWGIVNVTSSWQLKENSISTPAGTRKIRIMLAKRQGEGSVWFDDVRLMQDSPNLALNPGFEILNDSGKPNFWKEDSKGGWSSDTQGPYEGKRSMQATLAWSWLFQEIPVESERYYILRAYVKSDITVSEKEDYYSTFLTLECLDKEYEVIHKDWGIVNATSSWELKENSISTPPGTKKIRIMLAKRQGEGSVWFDDVTLVEMPSTLILNPGFEMLDASGRPKFWKEHAYGGWYSDTRGSFEGERSMRNAISWSWLSQGVPARPKTYYTLRAYLRSDITIPEKKDYANSLLTLECLDKNNELLKRAWGVTNATLLWQPREHTIFTPPETSKIMIKLAKRQGDGTVWFDGLELTRHRYPPHLWGDKPFFIFYFSIYALLALSLLRLIFKKSRPPLVKNK